jgi:hypothetical protein
MGIFSGIFPWLIWGGLIFLVVTLFNRTTT